MKFAGRGFGVQRAPHEFLQFGQRGRGGRGGSHNCRGDPLAESVVRYGEYRAVGHCGVSADGRFDRAGHDGEPSGVDRLVGPPQHRQPTGFVEATQVVGVEPSRLPERVRLWRIAISRRQGGASDHDAALTGRVGIVDPHLHPVQRHPVIDTPPRGLAGAVAPHHGDPRFFGTAQHRCGGRSATEKNGVQFGERGAGSRVGQSLGQLVGHQGGVAAAGTELGYRTGNIGGIETLGDIQLGRNRAGQDAAHHDLNSGDVVGRQRHQPTSRAAESVVGC